ncbi:MAG TPA: hypothetical protein VIM11_12000 [Tepidisphaeraceae bacterium]|jgi:hypothetical protein
MRLLLAILAILSPASILHAQDAPQSPQTAAALTDARESLHRQILSSVIAPGLTVHDLIDQTGGDTELTVRLQTAQQIGGTRWLDDQTAQVRLVIEGQSVAQFLIQIVEKNPGKSSVPPEVIKAHLADWRNRTYAATGTSTGAADVTRLQPPPGNAAWSSVSAENRNRALAAARDNATTRLTDSIRPVEITTGQTIDSALAVPDVNSALSTWLSRRPITSVDFRDDLSIRITMSIPPDELFQTLRAALTQQKQVPLPTTESGWSLVQKQIEARLAPPVGVGLVQPANPARQPEILLPDFAPTWANQQSQAEATSPSRGSKLHTARVAEDLAIKKLRTQVEALKLRDNLTLGEAARRDPRIAAALTKALNRAHPYQVDYAAGGAVTVRVAFDLSDLWTLLSDRR